MTVKALKGRSITSNDVRGVVYGALEGISDAVDHSIPAERKSALRGVFSGLKDAFLAIASAGKNTVAGVKDRGSTIATKSAPAAGRKMIAAKDDLLHAVSSFASRTSGELGEELHSAVKRAKRTGKAVGDSVRRADKAAGGNYAGLTKDTAKAGVSAARSVAGQLAWAMSGLLEGVGEAASPRPASSSRTTKKKSKKGGRAGKRAPRPKSR